MNRSTRIVEVTDISDENAQNYLERYGVSEMTAKNLVDLLGGRFAYLHGSVKLFEIYKATGLSDNELCNEIKQDIIAITLENQKHVLTSWNSCSEEILQKVRQDRDDHLA